MWPTTPGAPAPGCDTKFEWEFPSGAKLAFDCVLNVTNPGSGDSTNVAALEFESRATASPPTPRPPVRAADSPDR